MPLQYSTMFELGEELAADPAIEVVKAIIELFCTDFDEDDVDKILWLMIEGVIKANESEIELKSRQSAFWHFRNLQIINKAISGFSSWGMRKGGYGRCIIRLLPIR